MADSTPVTQLSFSRSAVGDGHDMHDMSEIRGCECTKGKGKVNRCINLIWKVYLLSSPLGHTFLSKVNLSWPKWRQEIPYSLTVHQKFIRKMWWANNGLVEGFNLQLPDYLSLFEIYWGAGERILKVTKKSGNRGRCRKLSLWSSSFWSWTTYTSLLSSFLTRFLGHQLAGQEDSIFEFLSFGPEM